MKKARAYILGYIENAVYSTYGATTLSVTAPYITALSITIFSIIGLMVSGQQS
jgi:hypothetical protein